MQRRRLVQLGASYLLVSTGVFVLAFTSVADVFHDPRRGELGVTVSDSNANLAWIIVSAFLIALGLTQGVSMVSRARIPSRYVGQIALFSSVALLVILHTKLFINSRTIAPQVGRAVVNFTAGYFFHTGEGYTFLAVYAIFLVTILLLALAVASAAYLIAPERFRAVFGRRSSWDANESMLMASSLFVVFSVLVFAWFLVQLAVDADRGPGRPEGFLADQAVGLHYLAATLLGVLILVVAARVYLVNWGTMGPRDDDSAAIALENVGRIERVVLGAVALIYLLLLIAPPIASPTYLSQDPVFRLNTHSLAGFFVLAMVPYGVYLYSLTRLERMLDRGGGPDASRTPFSRLSLKLMFSHVAGLVLISAILGAVAVNDAPEPLAMLMAYASWSSLVFLLASVRFEIRHGLPMARLRGAAGAAPFIGFVVLGFATSLMLWGAGNTFVATYIEGASQPSIHNESIWGAEVLSRFAATLIAGLTMAIGLSVLANTMHVRRPMALNHLAVILSVVIGVSVVFTVAVYPETDTALRSASVGLSFHQFGVLEKWLVAFVIVVSLAGLYFGIGRSLFWATRPRLIDEPLKRVDA